MTTSKILFAVFLFLPTILGYWEYDDDTEDEFPFPHGGFNNFRSRARDDDDLNPFSPNFGRKLQEKIQSKINVQMSQLQQTLNEKLRPVKIMSLRNSMAQGTGGVAVIHYGGHSVQFVMNSNAFRCPSKQVTINNDGMPQCSVQLIQEYKIDPCTFHGSFARNNDYYCFGSHVNLWCENGACYCNGGVVYNITQLKQMCGPTYDTVNYVQYQYYPDISDPNSIALPLKPDMNFCESTSNSVCVWHGAGFPNYY